MHVPYDIVVACAGVAALGVACFGAGVWVGRRSVMAAAVAGGAAAVVLVLHAVWLNDNLILTRLVPVADAIIWANPQAPMTGLLAGIAWARLKGPPRQRVLLVTALVLIGAWRVAGPLLGSSPPVGPDRWTAGVCQQSSTSSCSAAAAATVLAAHGIPSGEREMIDLCLTRLQGTTMLGLYRGLKLKTAGTAWAVDARNAPAGELLRGPLPAVVTIGLPGNGAGLLPSVGNRHSVVVLGVRADGKIDIGDPFGGRQAWTRGQFEAAYGGQRIAIVARR